MAFERLKSIFRRPTPEVEPEVAPAPDIRERRAAFSTAPLPLTLGKAIDIELARPQFTAVVNMVNGLPVVASAGVAFDHAGAREASGVAFDSAIESHGMDSTQMKRAFTMGQGAIPDDLFNWYSTQSFIGYQACAIISQHWLVDKIMTIPAKAAVRNGYELGSVDGEEIDLKTLAAIRRADKEFKLAANLVEFAQNTRRFGVRVAIFKVESPDPGYYEKPFNIDGVKKGAYKGISQVDPSWVAPMLDAESVADPASIHFYEPTYWLIAGQLYHHSHVVLARYSKPADVLMPSYQYGGIPLTQLVLERVYAAERTANEAPMLVETKRLNILYTDVAKVVANPGGFVERLQQLIGYRNNFGAYVADLEDRVEQIETSLTDLDAVIMSQYQLVAAVAGMPATELLSTSPKGFNATGESEETSYHNLLEGIQTDLTPLIERHHQLTVRSLGLGNDVEVVAVWNPVSSPNAKEQAEINLINAQRDNALMLSGGVDANDIRRRLIADPNSGFTGLQSFEDMDEIEDEDLDFGNLDGPGGSAAGAKAPPEEASEAEPLEETEAEDEAILGYVSVRPSPARGEALARWLLSAGIDNGVEPGNFHVTLAYSATGIPNYVADQSTYELTPTGEITIMGGPDTPALALIVESEYLRARYDELTNYGELSTYDEYRPHLTLKYDPAPGDFETARAGIAANPIEAIVVGDETIRPVK